MKRPLLITCMAALTLGLAACQATKPPSAEIPADPDDAVCELRAAWQSAPGCTLYSGAPCEGGGETRSKAMIRRQAENLAFRHPDHIETRMLCGVLAYEAEDPVTAVHHLDHVLRIRPATPEAAVLRARISLEQGNEQQAIRILEDQTTLRPDAYAVREALASAYFMNERHDEARSAIDAAERLGAPSWRVAYNRGLLSELDGEFGAASAHYESALADAPDWHLPRERLQGLDTVNAPPAMAMPEAGFPPPSEP